MSAPLGSEARPQRELEESRGRLLRVREAEGRCVAEYSWGSVSLPGEMTEKLQGFVGREVACLRLDNEYHVREVVGRA